MDRDDFDIEPFETESRTAGQSFDFRPRDTHRAVAQSEAYSKLIGILRWALPVFILLALAALVIWPMMTAEKLTTAVTQAIPNLMVENLNFTGLDEKNQPYKLTADKALQAGKTKNFIDLEKPKGEISLEDGSSLAGTAVIGRFDQTNKRLWLGGNVLLSNDKGYQFTTSEALVDMNENTAWGQKPIVIQGDFGKIQGQGFRVLDRGAVVVITGRTKARLNLQATQPSGK